PVPATAAPAPAPDAPPRLRRVSRLALRLPRDRWTVPVRGARGTRSGAGQAGRPQTAADERPARRTMTQRVTGELHATTILAVRRGHEVAMAGDGQVTVGDVVMKHTARKIRQLRDGQVLAGFAGSTADALTLFDKFEQMLDRYQGNLRRAAVEL